MGERGTHVGKAAANQSVDDDDRNKSSSTPKARDAVESDYDEGEVKAVTGVSDVNISPGMCVTSRSFNRSACHEDRWQNDGKVTTWTKLLSDSNHGT